MDWKKEWKENKFGILSLLFLFVFVFLFAFPDFIGALTASPTTAMVLWWAFAIIGTVFLVLSFLKKEKGKFFRIVSLVILGVVVLVTVYYLFWYTPFY
ncbi:MAG: hypothetical protein NT067_01045 [Candidatus Diapherotrites archaeon]|nr:hypothetical protein [Candidatus Diapherotrites archaeon]